MGGFSNAVLEAQIEASRRVERQLAQHLQSEGVPPADDFGWMLTLRERFPLNDVAFERALEEARARKSKL